MITFHSREQHGWLIHSRDTAMTFPAGEQHIKDHAPDSDTPLCVVVTGTDMNEYTSAAMWIDLQHQRGHKVTALIPYLPGARQDRGRPFGAKVYADLINAMHADRVVAVDPHSPVITELVDNLDVFPVTRLIRKSVGQYLAGEWENPYVGVIAPDAGAVDRATATGRALHLPMYKAEKHRDFETGKLSGFSCEPLPDAGRLLVVDDICDGGGTFRGLAEATGLPKERLDLWITHGVFSGAAGKLRNHFCRIHTTDSHPGHAREGVATDIHPLLPTLIGEVLK